MRHTLIELAHLTLGLIAVVAITEAAAWSYPLGRAAIAWTGRASAVIVVLLAIRGFREAWAKDRAGG